MAKYEVVTGCPVPAALAPELREIARIANASLNSCYRGTDAESLLRKLGKKSQRQLYNLFLAGRGNPANPPGKSTHELRNDGAAYRYLPRGARLRYWMVGQDWNKPAAVMAAGRKRGWTITLTYPGSPGEGQHLNFRKEPKFNPFKNLKQGAKGIRVARMTGRLAYLGYLPGVSAKVGTQSWGPKVTAALKKFQKHYHQKQDGVYGIHSERQLLASVGHLKAERKAAADLEKKVLDKDEKHNLKVYRDFRRSSNSAQRHRAERAKNWLHDRAHRLGVLGRNEKNGWAKYNRGVRYQIITKAID